MASLAESVTNPYLSGNYAPVHDEMTWGREWSCDAHLRPHVG